MAKTWSRCRSRALICSNAGYIHIKVDQWLLCRSCRGKYLSCSTTHSTGCTYKSRGIVVSSVQTVAAIANDESLQVRVRKAHPPLREVISAPFGAQRCQNRVSPIFVKCCVIAKIVLLRARPCETGETGPILAWYLYLFVQNWKCRTSTEGTKVLCGHPPLPLSTTRLLGTRS